MNAKRKILIVEDEIDLSAQLEKMLETQGLDVTAAQNGINGLDKLKTETFNVVVTDVRLPGLDGLQLLSHMREMKLTAPVILVSGAADKEMAIQGIKLGAFDFLEKPFRAAEMIAAVKKALSTETDETRYKLQGLDLSQVQVKIVELLFTGIGNKEIAAQVHLSEQGVKYHIGILFQRFEVKNRGELKAKLRSQIKSA